MEIVSMKRVLLAASGALLVSAYLTAFADVQIDTHTSICVSEGKAQTECLCKATAMKALSATAEEYGRTVTAVQAIGDAKMSEIYTQVMAQDSAHAQAYSVAYAACIELQTQ